VLKLPLNTFQSINHTYLHYFPLSLSVPSLYSRTVYMQVVFNSLGGSQHRDLTFEENVRDKFSSVKYTRQMADCFGLNRVLCKIRLDEEAVR